MKSIFFEDKVINFTGDLSIRPAGGEPRLAPDDLQITKVLQKFGNSNTLWVVSADYDALFERFCALFHREQAAGGVVKNMRGDVLMILRRGRWDLPKGHRERGETWEACALREVAEECGLTDVELGAPVACTRHTYLLDGRWVLKECRWFAMEYRGRQTPVPQAEEQIERVEWVAPERMATLLEHAYQTIKNVLNTQR